jgi:hypothetical protein
MKKLEVSIEKLQTRSACAKVLATPPVSVIEEDDDDEEEEERGRRRRRGDDDDEEEVITIQEVVVLLKTISRSHLTSSRMKLRQKSSPK